MYFPLQFQVLVLESGWTSKVGHTIPSQEQREIKVCLFTDLLIGAQLDFSAVIKQLRKPNPGNDTSHSGLGLPVSVKIVIHRPANRLTQCRWSLTETLLQGDNSLIRATINTDTFLQSCFCYGLGTVSISIWMVGVPSESSEVLKSLDSWVRKNFLCNSLYCH